MADNYTANPGSGGETFSADDISSVKYPRVKLIHGVDGVNDGDVSGASPLPTRASCEAATVDVASSTITATETSSAVLSSAPVHFFDVVVTAASGGSPYLGVQVEESLDGGTTWDIVYCFAAISGTGTYRSGPVRTRGDRFRYVQNVVAGSSFTRSIRRQRSPCWVDGASVQLVRYASIVGSLSALGDATSPLPCAGMTSAVAAVRGWMSGSSPTYQLQGTFDGETWVNLADTIFTLTGSDGTKVVAAPVALRGVTAVRLYLSGAGSGVNSRYELLKVF